MNTTTGERAESSLSSRWESVVSERGDLGHTSTVDFSVGERETDSVLCERERDDIVIEGREYDHSSLVVFVRGHPIWRRRRPTLDLVPFISQQPATYRVITVNLSNGRSRYRGAEEVVGGNTTFHTSIEADATDKVVERIAIVIRGSCAACSDTKKTRLADLRLTDEIEGAGNVGSIFKDTGAPTKDRGV